MTRFLMHGDIKKRKKEYLLLPKQIILDSPNMSETHTFELKKKKKIKKKK